MPEPTPAARHRVRTAATWISATALVVALLLMLVAWTSTRSWARGRLGLQLNNGALVVAVCNAPMRASSPGWRIGGGTVLLQPAGRWLPTTASAHLFMGAAAVHLRAFSLPLWMPVVMFAGGVSASAVCRRRAMRAPGSCAKCGYNLEGISASRCPECGEPLLMITRGLSVLQRYFRPLLALPWSSR